LTIRLIKEEKRRGKEKERSGNDRVAKKQRREKTLFHERLSNQQKRKKTLIFAVNAKLNINSAYSHSLTYIHTHNNNEIKRKYIFV